MGLGLIKNSPHIAILYYKFTIVLTAVSVDSYDVATLIARQGNNC